MKKADTETTFLHVINNNSDLFIGPRFQQFNCTLALSQQRTIYQTTTTFIRLRSTHFLYFYFRLS